jgi:hypothetical protein
MRPPPQPAKSRWATQSLRMEAPPQQHRRHYANPAKQTKISPEPPAKYSSQQSGYQLPQARQIRRTFQTRHIHQTVRAVQTIQTVLTIRTVRMVLIVQIVQTARTAPTIQTVQMDKRRQGFIQRCRRPLSRNADRSSRVNLNGASPAVLLHPIRRGPSRKILTRSIRMIRCRTSVRSCIPSAIQRAS